jgi:GxxExxY protein
MENTDLSTNFTNFTNKDKVISQNTDILFKAESFRVIGAAMEVYNNLGCGFLEPVYQEALEKEFVLQAIPFSAQLPLRIQYKNTYLEKTYIDDFVVYEKIIVELKAVNKLDNVHVSQVLNYLKATNLRLGILINFGAKSLESKRIVH